MSIYKQENKIIRNLAGEILTEPPVIDISSDYGVTKDGSNLVSSVKDRNQPLKFTAPSGYQPIENGDGIEFPAAKAFLQNNLGWHITRRGFSILIDLKILASGGTAMFTGRWRIEASPFREWLFYYEPPTKTVKLLLMKDSDGTAPDVSFILPNIPNFRQKFLLVGKYVGEDLIVDLYIDYVLFGTDSIIGLSDVRNTGNTPIELGGMSEPIGSTGFLGNIYNLKIWDYPIK